MCCRLLAGQLLHDCVMLLWSQQYRPLLPPEHSDATYKPEVDQELERTLLQIGTMAISGLPVDGVLKVDFCHLLHIAGTMNQLLANRWSFALGFTERVGILLDRLQSNQRVSACGRWCTWMGHEKYWCARPAHMHMGCGSHGITKSTLTQAGTQHMGCAERLSCLSVRN